MLVAVGVSDHSCTCQSDQSVLLCGVLLPYDEEIQGQLSLISVIVMCGCICVASYPGFPSPRQKVQRKEKGKLGRFARTHDVINIVNLMSVGYT